MFCSISGETPIEPVVSTKSGHLFEKRLITKFIEENGTCPITEQSLTLEDLLPLSTNTSVKPRPPTMNSVPALLSTLQNEWDTLMLETFQMKQQNQQLRQELSQALYQQDAAARVCARLMKERDEARDALKDLKSQLQNVSASNGHHKEQEVAAPTEEEMVTDENALPEQVTAVIQSTAQKLSSQRKNRAVPENLVTKEQLGQFKVQQSVDSLHSSTAPQINAMAVDLKNSNLLVTAGADKTLLIYDRQADQIQSTLKGHTKPVTAVFWASQSDQSLIVSASADKSIRSWLPEGQKNIKSNYIMKLHQQEVTGLALHPSGQFFVSVSLDGSWSLNDLQEGKSIYQHSSEDDKWTAVAVHPDGQLFATGSQSGKVCIWDLLNQKVAFECPELSQGKITSLSFSENGYYFASASSDSATAKIWDLRKLAKIKELELPEASSLVKVLFDSSASYLAVVAANRIQIFQSKKWNLLADWQHEGSDLTDFCFGDTLDSFAVCSTSDNTLKYYAL